MPRPTQRLEEATTVPVRRIVHRRDRRLDPYYVAKLTRYRPAERYSNLVVSVDLDIGLRRPLRPGKEERSCRRSISKGV